MIPPPLVRNVEPQDVRDGPADVGIADRRLVREGAAGMRDLRGFWLRPHA